MMKKLFNFFLSKGEASVLGISLETCFQRKEAIK